MTECDAKRPQGGPPNHGTKPASEVPWASARSEEIRRLAGTMRPAEIAKQLGVDLDTVSRLLGWRSMPDLVAILPAPPAEVYRLITARTTDRNTIRRRIDVFCRAIADRTFAKDNRRALLAIHRQQPDRPLVAGLPIDHLMHLAVACQDDPAGLRDRALLLLLAVSGLNLAALARLDVEHIYFAAATVQLTIDATDEWAGRLIVPSAANPSLCPIQALRKWLQASDTQFGPVFRNIGRRGNIKHRRLSSEGLRRIVRHHVATATNPTL